jgi:hypothetical protein
MLLFGDLMFDPSYNQQEAIQKAAAHKCELQIFQLLLADKRIDPSVHRQQVLKDICAKGSSEVVRLLLTDSRVDPSIRSKKV